MGDDYSVLSSVLYPNILVLPCHRMVASERPIVVGRVDCGGVTEEAD